MRALHIAIIAILAISPLVPIALGATGTHGIADGILRAVSYTHLTLPTILLV